MTLRRLGVLLRALPPTALLWKEIQAAYEKSLIPTEDKIRERQRYYDEQARLAASAERDADGGDPSSDEQHDGQHEGV